VQAVITSPPYWGQRDYGFQGQIGLEPVYTDYVAAMVEVARGVRRVLASDGVFWLNIGDTYNTRAIIRPSSHQGGLGHDNASIQLSWAEARDRGLVRYSARQPGLKDKDLMLLPYRVAQALVEDGWYLRCDVLWAKPYGAPENAPDRPSRLHESIFMFTPNSRCKFYKQRCPEGARSVWTIAPGKGDEHRAVFPDELVRRCVLLSTDENDVVADPFVGSGTTVRVARSLGRVGIGLDARDYGPVGGGEA
jgi:site-specific DNA-methyltransferase (cytosine-N4-specific)